MVYEGFLYALKEEGIEKSKPKPTIRSNFLHAVQTVPAEEGKKHHVVLLYQSDTN